MSEWSNQEKLDIVGLFVGFFVIIILGGLAQFWSDGSEEFYQQSDLEPGTFLMFGLLFVLPLLVYGGIIFVKGIITLILVYGRKYQAASASPK